MKLLYVFLTILCSAAGVHAQELSIPSTPAFSILGYEPTSVMRPSSVKKLSTDVLNSFDSDGKLIMNLGLEVTPYWLTSRPELSRDEYLNPKPVQSFMQTFSISAATVRDTVTGANNLGVGFRVQLVKGKLSDEFAMRERELNEYETILSAINSVRTFAGTSISSMEQAVASLQTILVQSGIAPKKASEVIARANTFKGNYTDDTAAIRSFAIDLADSYNDEMSVLAQEVIVLENKRTGLSIEVAGASKFITSSHESFDRAGAWVNVNNYFTENDAWTVTARLMATSGDTTSVNTDIGFGYIKTGTDFNVSVEGMLRWYRNETPDINSAGMPITTIEKDMSYRIAAQVSYAVTENASVNLSIGKDFDDQVLQGSGYFSIFGINYSIFNKLVGR